MNVTYRPFPNKCITDVQAYRNRRALMRVLPTIINPFVEETVRQLAIELEEYMNDHPDGANSEQQAHNDALTTVAAIFGGLEITEKDGKLYATYDAPGLKPTAPAEVKG